MEEKRKSKGKKVNVAVASTDDPAYDLLGQELEASHPELVGAGIALVWRFGWRPDADGRLTLGQARRCTDPERLMHGTDFLILLNSEAWHGFDERQRRALLDHELSHCAPALDDGGEQGEDEEGRPVWRTRGHDAEEFVDVVKRHGLWRSDLERLAAAAMKSQQGAKE